MALKFGIPKKRVSREEVDLFPNRAVMTILPYQGKGTARKFILNKKALETLGLECNGEEYVSIATDETGKVYLANTTSALDNTNVIDESDNFRVTKAGTFSNAKAYKFFIEKFGLDQDLESHLELSYVENMEGVIVCELAILEEVNIEVESNESNETESEQSFDMISEEEVTATSQF